MADETRYKRGTHPRSLANLEKGTWKKGQSGNPVGKPASGPVITPHLRRFAQMQTIELLNMPQEVLDRLTPAEMVAYKIICEAMTSGPGMQHSTRELLERLDGKVKESIEMKTEGEMVITTVIVE